MPANFAINGFGRIGRSAFRVWLKRFQQQMNLVAINTSGSLPVSGWAHLANYDTAYGPLDEKVEYEHLKDPKEATDSDPLIGYLKINAKENSPADGRSLSAGRRIPVLAQRDPEKLPWKDYAADIIIESTGVFRTEEEAGKHLKAGANHVIISAPSKGDDPVDTYVTGVNTIGREHKSRSNTYAILSNASCTTNSVAPVAHLMHSKLGIKKAMLTTVHGYTDDQNLQDNSHKDMRRARAAAMNLVPTSTGAAKATTEVIPELKNLFDGIAIRVPVITGSITDFTFITNKSTSVEEVNEMFRLAADNFQYKGILAVTDEPLVSSDIIGRSESSIVDLGMTRVVDGDLVKIIAWYDNEWGYSNRLVEQVLKISEN